MDLKRPHKLRISGRAGADDAPAGDSGLRSFPVNEVAELVADLIEATGLVTADRLASVRGRVKQGGSFAQAVLDEGVATSEGIARTYASRFQLPFIDLPLTGVSELAAGAVPIHVLERVVAVPYALEGEMLKVATRARLEPECDEAHTGTRQGETQDLGVALHGVADHVN
jgi:hypothetical protein